MPLIIILLFNKAYTILSTLPKKLRYLLAVVKVRSLKSGYTDFMDDQEMLLVLVKLDTSMPWRDRKSTIVQELTRLQNPSNFVPSTDLQDEKNNLGEVNLDS